MNKVEELRATFRQEELDDIKEIASSRGGRRFLWRLFSQCNVFSTTFSSDPYSTAFNEGQRNIGLIVLNDMMQAAPEKFVTAQRGAKEREERYGRQLAGLSDSDE